MSSPRNQDSEDALEPLVTQCPNCDTRFRVSESQLQVAGGRVRCGACLTVFDGADFLMLDGEPLGAAADDIEGEEDTLDAVLGEIDDFEERQEPPQDAAQEEMQEASQDEAEVTAGSQPVNTVSEPQADEHAELDEDTLGDLAPDLSQLEALEDELLSELVGAQREASEEKEGEEKEGTIPQPAPEVELASEPNSLATQLPTDTVHEPTQALEDSAPAMGEEEQSLLDAAEDIDRLDELPAFAEDRELAERVSAAADEPEAAAAPAQSAQDWTTEVADDIWQTAEMPVESDQGRDSLAGVAAGGSLADAGADSTETMGDVVDATSAQSDQVSAQSAAVAQAAHVVGPGDESSFDDQAFEEDHAVPDRSWLTYILIALAIIALPAQVLWFQYEDWVGDPQFRPIYVNVCGVIGCDVPALVDIAAIEAQRSVGRVSPEDGVRTIDILMVNKATFAQPFPVIEVVFENLQGSQVAVSRLSADQYLPDSQPANAQMQPRTPVHVSFDVPDPGVDATGFSVRFLAP